MRKSLRRAIVFLSLVLIFSLVGCANNKPATAPSASSQGTNAQPYKIGAILTTTGANAQMGIPEKEAIQYNVDKVNKAGGINGHPLQLVVEDDEGIPGKAQSLAIKLIEQDGVSAILGSTASATVQSVAIVAEEKKVPLIHFSPTDSIAKGKKYIFYVPPGAALDAKAISKFLAKDLKISTIGIINDTSDYGKNAALEFEQAISQYPELKNLAKETYDPTDLDMTPQLLKIESKKPDVIYIGGSGTAPAKVLKNLKQTGYTGKIVGSSGVANDATIKNAGDAAEGIYISARLNYGNPASNEKELFNFVKEKNGGLPSSFSANGWDGILLLINALQSAGNDREKIRAALENTKGLQGVIGMYNMTPTDHNGLPVESIKMVRIKNGQWVHWNS